MNRTLTLLITGVGSPGAPGVIKSLRSVQDRRFKLVGIDMSPNHAAKQMVDQFAIGPKAADADFVEKTLELCADEKVDVVLPMVTAELLVFAKNKQRFSEIGTTVSVSDEKRLKPVIHKGQLFETLKRKGIQVPEHVRVHSPAQLRRAFQDLGYPNRPVCFKPVISDGSRGFHVIDPEIDNSRLLFYEKPTSVYVDFEHLFEVVRDDAAIPELLAMEYLPNEEYSVDLLANHGKVLVAVPRLREETAAGISVKGTVVQEPDIIAYATTITEQLGLHGNIGIQIRRDKDHHPKILEINPRIQGTIVHCTAAGVNLPYLAVKQALGHPIGQDELNVRWGVRMARYWEETYFDENDRPVDF
ncbi:MAG TPA: ATP-grasp domain-containing protein [Bacillales bacterium]|nr:ATP-grasp domain-containing protein [Bacillales bacterium]